MTPFRIPLAAALILAAPLHAQQGKTPKTPLGAHVFDEFRTIDGTEQQPRPTPLMGAAADAARSAHAGADYDDGVVERWPARTGRARARSAMRCERAGRRFVANGRTTRQRLPVAVGPVPRPRHRPDRRRRPARAGAHRGARRRPLVRSAIDRRPRRSRSSSTARLLRSGERAPTRANPRAAQRDHGLDRRSNVYGSDEERADALRTHDGTGRLEVPSRVSSATCCPSTPRGLPNAGGPSPDALPGRRRAGQRAGRPDGAAHALRPRAQPWADRYIRRRRTPAAGHPGRRRL